METECKRILLLKGLQPLNDDQFSMVKSLLDSDLGLTPKMKEEYTKVKIADMMHKKFRGILCVNELLRLLKDIEGLEDTVKTIKNEKRKVMKKYKTQGLAPGKKRKQEVSSTDESTSTANKASRPVDDTLVSKKRKTKTTSNNKSNKTQPTSEWGQLGQPSVTGALSPASFSQPPQMPPPTPGCSFSTKKRKTKATSSDKSKTTQPTLEWGQLGQPAVTGALSPASFSQPPRMPPPTPGSSFSTQKKKTQNTNTAKSETTQPKQEWGQLGQPSVTGALSPVTFSQPPQMPPPTPGSSFSTQKMETQTIKTEKFEMMQPVPEWGQLGQPSVMGALSPGSFSPPPWMPPSTPGSSFSTKKPRLKSVPTKPSREEGLQTCAKEVMVLKATEPFAYDITDEERRMFHATVVTESQFFRVKVFHVGLKDKFIPKRVITLADYIGRNGFLEVYNVSSVSDVSADRKMEVSSRLIQNANATPKIKELRLEEPGTFVSGVYQVHKKMVLDQCMTLYEIQDDTGTMDVLVYGRLTKVNCEKGDKLTLVCFELSRDPRQLRSVTHSFIKTHTLLPPVFPMRTVPSTLGIAYTCSFLSLLPFHVHSCCGSPSPGKTRNNNSTLICI
ncbi:gamma-interferon-inducible protein 16-like isoform X7 [Prionailurus bengalensis]|uniref:gamma-interferon-inducible protein 16-like isoform X7 n=1 Tax=Prionailurus bengalensis TaxID=37029 RepID=UPI001CA7D4A2|nr:gamma-interferon-inducible protein 16-like isoform X7 [Prionailurus bengalensis]XP_043424795.1 gamma-interferon-inducible protein 16-like isoform X7 [Prionailurus bengalensis]